MRITKFIIGAVLAQIAGLLVTVALVYAIPVRGTELAIIVALLASVTVLGGACLSAVWAWGDRMQ